MHEVTLLIGVADQVGKAMEENGLSHVDQVVLEVGDLTPIVPEFMIDGYTFISDEYEFLKGSELIINTIVGMGICNDCGEEFAIVENEGKCPSCGSFSKRITKGQEFIIKEVRIRE